MDQVLEFYALLEETKRLSQLKHDYIEEQLRLRIKIDEISKKMKVFGLHLHSETWGAVKVERLDTEQAQFNRCKRAVQENCSQLLF